MLLLLQIAICLTYQTVIPFNIWSEAINWGINYNLPHNSTSFKDILYPEHVIQRRNRRDLFQKIEKITSS